MILRFGEFRKQELKSCDTFIEQYLVIDFLKYHRHL